jgi:lysophospholipase L1-like esterase
MILFQCNLRIDRLLICHVYNHREIAMTILLLLAAVLPALSQGEEPFFEQRTIASHEDQHQHRWPCIALLEEGRLLLTWSRAAAAPSDDAIVCSFSEDHGRTWSEPRTLIAWDGFIEADPNIVVSGSRVFILCTSVNFEKGIRTSTTWCVRSEDGGNTWSKPYTVPMNHLYTCGKTHRGLRLADGTLVMGYAWDVLCESGTAHDAESQMDLRAGVMRSTDNGETWVNGGDTHAEYTKATEGVSGTDEPALTVLENGVLYMLMRTGADHLYEARSTDGGVTWTEPVPSPLYGSNAPAAVCPISAGNGEGTLVVWNNALKRFPLCAAASFDNAQRWSAPKDIGIPYTGGQASYPSCVQAADGALVAVWQQDVPGGRDIRCARFNTEWLLRKEPEPEAVVVLFGDSTTAPREGVHIFTDRLAEQFPRVKFINAGVGSNTTDLARQRFQQDVLDNSPIAVTLFFGLNDAAADVWQGMTEPRIPVEEYAENLRYFVRTLRETGAMPILLTPNPMAWTPELLALYGKPPYDTTSDAGFNLLLEPYVEAVRRVAREENASLIDVNRMFKDHASEAGNSLHDLLTDGMHPNSAAHEIIAGRIAALLQPLLPSENAGKP